MRKLLGTTLAAGLLFGGALAANADPGPADGDSPNAHGMCTAYFNGQKNGHNKGGKESPPPFAQLELVADDGDDDTSVAEDVLQWCNEAGADIGGNPEQGRYPDLFGEDDEG